MGTTLITAFETGLTAIQTDVVSLLIVVVPLALVIFGIIFAIRFGKKGFRTISK